jgi:predicted nucleic acid-binding protein
LTDPFIDTDVIIRYLTGDDAVKQRDAATLFERVEAGELILRAPDTVVADAVYVLSSRRLYGIDHGEVQALLTPLVRSPGFRVQNKRALERALQLFGSTNLGFGDAMIIATMELEGARELYSYDTDFDRVSLISRRAPA